MKTTKWEQSQCEHGRIRWSRWVWANGGVIEDSTPEYRTGCKLCNE